MDWFYVENGAQRGPVGEEEFLQLETQGVISPTTLVWRAGMPEWAPRSRVPNFGDVVVTPETAAAHGMAACAECGVLFPQEDMIEFRGTWICAACKPVFFQRIKEGVTVPGVFNYGGFWIRAGAYLIDYIILLVVGSIVSFSMTLIGGASGREGIFLGASVLASLFNLAVGITYHTWFVGKYQATPGKMAVGLKIVRPDGERLTYLRAFARYFAYSLSFLILGIGFIMAAFDDEKRALHDRVCDTRVIRAASAP